MKADTPAESGSACGCGDSGGKRDWFLISFVALSAATVILGLWNPSWLTDLPRLHGFCHAVIELLGKMWWGLLFGISAIGILSHVPRDWITAALGRGIWKAITLGERRM